MTTGAIWTGTIIIYAVFWSWYVGFGNKISPELTERALVAVKKVNPTDKEFQSFKNFFESDDGKEFVMYNAIHLAQPMQESAKKLQAYGNAYLGDLLKKAGHPIFAGMALESNLDALNVEHADDWTVGTLVRYRNRTDFAEMVIKFAASPEHNLKLESAVKTFAFPSSPTLMLGDVKILFALGIALIATILQLAIRTG